MMTVNCRESCGCARGRCEEKRLGFHHLCFDAIWLEIRRGGLAAAPATTAPLPLVISSQSIQNNFRQPQIRHLMTCENCGHEFPSIQYCSQLPNCIFSCIPRTQLCEKLPQRCPLPRTLQIRRVKSYDACFRRQGAIGSVIEQNFFYNLEK